MKEHNIRLTSAEIANLWNTYMNDCLAICVLSHFRETTQDLDTHLVIEHALELSKKHIRIIKEMFKEEHCPIPKGFGSEDLNLKAPALFLDTFYLHYIKQMSRIGLGAYGLALALAARSDMREFFTDCLHQTSELDDKVTKVLESKGLYIRAPFISAPSKIEFVKRQNFLGQLLGKQKHRPLLGIEITHIYANIQTNAMGSALLTGFSQVAKSKEVREYMVRGRDIADKHMEVLGSILSKSHLKAPMSWSDNVTNSTISPFSDKLMMFHVGAILSVGIADYGASLGISLRKDISADYVRLTAEIGQYAEDGANLIIDNGWMEQPPQADDRDALAE